ncbi:MAG: class I SAM-dependent methyltransferase [Bryobacterales bacterium]
MGLTEQFGGLIPSFVLRRLLTVETAIEQGVTDFAAQTPTGARVLDAGAGEGRYAQYFPGRRYVGIDLAVGDAAWDYSGIDALGDLAKLPFPDDTFDAALNIVTLEHVPEPLAVLREIARVLRPGGRLFLVAAAVGSPPGAGATLPLHPARVDDCWSARRLGGRAPRADGRFFTLLARRLTATLNYCQGGARWLLFPFVAVVVGPLALLLPSLDVLDPKKDFTLAYRCVARKP